ncbi:uncharacterized protein LOC106464693 [Limulus polyphemus]|uniref:Uncharacterized protein LOC106464693 n=1 Tax=Limulus polyphemus TaxID=6850 RepID=A0ABM1BEE2_LIMPO|nr:uncharacterized protein LOC106464693 [Limulus polyphemus]
MMQVYLITFLLVAPTLAFPVEETQNAVQDVTKAKKLSTEDEVSNYVPIIPVSQKVLPEDANTLLAVEEDGVIPYSVEFRPVALPTSFESYDKDNNGYIDLTELAQVSETSEEQATQPFFDADRDHDGLVNPLEFQHAPWNFQGEPFVTEEDQLDEKGVGEDLIPEGVIDGSYFDKSSLSSSEYLDNQTNHEEESLLLNGEGENEGPEIRKNEDLHYQNEDNVYELVPKHLLYITDEVRSENWEDIGDEYHNISSVTYGNDQWGEFLKPHEGKEFVDDELSPINDENIFSTEEDGPALE